MKIYSKATDKGKPTKPKVSRGTRKPAQPLDPTQQQVSGHVAETLISVVAAVNTPEVQAALATNDINTATDAFPWEVFDQKLSALAGPLEELVRRSLIIPHLMPKQAVIQTNFNHLDPRVAHAARTMSSKLATSMSAEQYSKVRTIIGNGVASGDTVKQISSALRNHIGLNARQDRQMSTAVLDATQEAIDAGFSGEALTSYVEDATSSLYDRMVAYRADLIARTETMAAQNTGFMLGVQQAVEDPQSSVDTTWLKRWIATDDERTCPVCGVLDGQEIPLDENFTTEDGDEIGYPLEDGSTPHPQCRCTVGLVPPNRDVAGLADQSAADSTDAEQMAMDFASSLTLSREIIDMALAMFNKTFNLEQERDEHGRWTSGGNSNPTWDGLRKQAQQFATFEDFSRAVSLQGLKPLQWHITSDPNFKPDPNVRPTNAQGGATDEPALFVGNPDYWQEYATGRGTVAEYDLSNLRMTNNPLSDTTAHYYPDQSGNPGMVIRPEGYGLLQETGKMSLSQAIARSDAQQSQMPQSKAEAQQIWDTRYSLTKAFTKEFNPDEPRDEQGKWTSGGGMPYALKASPYTVSSFGPYFNPDMAEKAKTAFKNVAEDPVRIRMTANSLDHLVKDGRLKGASEVQLNQGGNRISQGYLVNRDNLEHGLWGIPRDATPPIYGYLDSNYDRHRPEVDAYGGITLTLKDEIAGRTTMTSGDSLNSQLVPVPLADARAGNLSDVQVGSAVGDGPWSSPGTFRGASSVIYFETQIHGGVTLSDIQSVNVGADYKISASTRNALLDNGIEVTGNVASRRK